jgi:hypothetical protein
MKRIREESTMKHRLLFALALVTLAVGLAATAAAGGGRARPYVFNGVLLNVSSTSAQVQVEGGNHAALRALLGQSQSQTFTLGPTTQVLIWSHGVPHTGSVADLKQGDFVTLRIRAAFGASLAEIEGTPAAILADHARPGAGRPLWLFVGTVTGPQSGGHIALHVASGNWKALQAMLGQSLDQSFTYGNGTIFLLWQGRVPTVIDASQLRAGDRITIRIRAPRNSTLAQVEATPANHVGDHEPGNPETQTS